MALVPGGEDVIDAHGAIGATEGFDGGPGLVDSLSMLLVLGDDAGDRTSMARDDDGFAARDVIEDMGEVGCRLRGLDFARNADYPFQGRNARARRCLRRAAFHGARSNLPGNHFDRLSPARHEGVKIARYSSVLSRIAGVRRQPRRLDSRDAADLVIV